MHPVLQRIYAARGVTCAQDIEYELKSLIPFTELLHIEKASEILSTALKQQKRIVIIGDYDADGATSTALAVKALRCFGVKQVDFIVPNRFEYGYGLTPEIVELAKQQQAELLITVDNGITSVDGVAAAKQAGMQVIITDHHLAGEQLPAADAIVNPNQPNDLFASKNLAGVGVCFYMMLALRAQLRAQGWFEAQAIAVPNMAQFLDLVALGTVADVVPLDKNNRILVEQGLKRIQAGRCSEGIKAIATVAKKDCRKMVASDFGFAIGPRLNAAGRLDDMTLGIDCLLTNNIVKARLIASQLDQLNQDRKQLEGDMREQAMKFMQKLRLDERQLPDVICLYQPEWHQGVIGILAARIKERFHRPVIAFAQSNDHEIKGSARSIPGLHIRDVLEAVARQYPQMLHKYGGHAMAAGLSLNTADFDVFNQAVNIVVKDFLDDDIFKNVVYSDGLLHDDDLTLQLANALRQAGPWGQNFPEPVFDGEFNVLDQRLVGEKHLKLSLQSAGEKVIDAIAFNVDLKQWPNQRCQRLHCVYRLDVNEFRQVKKLQLIIQHLKSVRSY